MKNTDVEQKSTPVQRFNIRPLTKQCGMTYRGSENKLLSTGIQPFLVRIRKGASKCWGTLISPMHILTIATCLMMEDVSIADILFYSTLRLKPNENSYFRLHVCVSF